MYIIYCYIIYITLYNHSMVQKNHNNLLSNQNMPAALRVFDLSQHAHCGSDYKAAHKKMPSKEFKR